MINVLKSKSLYIGLVTVFALTACNTPTATTPGGVSSSPSASSGSNNTGSGTSTEVASMTGTVTKDGAAPGKNATVVLIDTDKKIDVKIERTTPEGSYVLKEVSKGMYRVAFLLSSEKERKDGTPTIYDPKDGYTSDFYAFVTTRPFAYDGDTKKTYQVPSFNVGWKSNLMPYDQPYRVDEDIKFSWGSAPMAKDYTLRIVEPDMKTTLTSFPATTDTSFTWAKDGKDRNKLQAGKTYYFSVNVNFNTDNAPADAPVLVNGGSALSKFTVK